MQEFHVITHKEHIRDISKDNAMHTTEKVNVRQSLHIAMLTNDYKSIVELLNQYGSDILHRDRKFPDIDIANSYLDRVRERLQQIRAFQADLNALPENKWVDIRKIVDKQIEQQARFLSKDSTSIINRVYSTGSVTVERSNPDILLLDLLAAQGDLICNGATEVDITYEIVPPIVTFLNKLLIAISDIIKAIADWEVNQEEVHIVSPNKTTVEAKPMSVSVPLTIQLDRATFLTLCALAISTTKSPEEEARLIIEQTILKLPSP